MANPAHDEQTISVTAGKAKLAGTLAIPPQAGGMVLFAHGSGSSRHSPRNRYVAQFLQQANLATLLLDLFTTAEEHLDEQTAELRFDIDFLAERLLAACDWIAQQPQTQSLPLGLFGASTGAGAALVAAADRPQQVRAVVSRGGRPDLAGAALRRVKSPALLIIGGEDRLVIQVNREAAELLQAEHRIEIVPGATHLFEEPGALARVAELARDWFLRCLHNSASRPA